MTKINFTIILPDFLDFLIPQKSGPLAGEIWFFSTRRCEIQRVTDEDVIVKTFAKSGIRVNKRDFIRYGYRLDRTTL